MDPRLMIRAIAVILLAGSAFACAVEVGHLGGDPDSPATSKNGSSDPVAAELARCSALGREAANDAACQAAWAKNRQHFFATGRAQQEAPPKTELDRAPSAPLPNAGDPPAVDLQGR